jgi:hypothetical protein
MDGLCNMNRKDEKDIRCDAVDCIHVAQNRAQ